MAKLMYPGANRSIRYRDPDAKGDLEQYVNRKEKGDQPQRVNRAGKGDQPQRVNRAGKGDQPQRVNRAGKGDQPQRVNRAEKGNPVRGATIPKPQPKPARTAESAAVPVKPKPKPVRPSAAAPVKSKPEPARPSAVKKPSAPAFKANFKGAAPTTMQARGGARINRGGGLLGMIKRKIGK
jgi:hypothetical protein